jgi:hypothetical protein
MVDGAGGAYQKDIRLATSLPRSLGLGAGPQEIPLSVLSENVRLTAQ